jgi:hypothetical protein
VDFKHDSLSDLNEADLVTRWLAAPRWREVVSGFARVSEDFCVKTSVSLEGAPGVRSGGQGDIDILLYSPGEPQNAVAIEAKRVKVGSGAMRSGSPNKVGGLLKGVEQVNRLADLGFSRVYLLIFVVVDTRELNAGKTSRSGMSNDMKSRIRIAVQKCVVGLSEKIGIMQCELVQSVDAPPLTVGEAGFHLIRQAEPVEQSPVLTKWVFEASKTANSGPE